MGDEKEKLEVMAFINKINRHWQNAHYLERLYDESDFPETSIDMRMDDTKRSGREFLNDEAVLAAVSSDEEKEKFIKKLIEEQGEAHREDVENTLLFFINYSFVMVWTAFETFMLDLLRLYIKEEPKILLHLLRDPNSKARRIDMVTILESNDYDELLNKLSEEALSNFSFKSMDDKLKILSKIGMDANKIFKKYISEEGQTKWADPTILLPKTAKIRNDVVHREELALKSVGALSGIVSFLSSFSIAVTVNAYQKYSINNDLLFPINKGQEEPSSHSS